MIVVCGIYNWLWCITIISYDWPCFQCKSHTIVQINHIMPSWLKSLQFLSLTNYIPFTNQPYCTITLPVHSHNTSQVNPILPQLYIIAFYHFTWPYTSLNDPMWFTWFTWTCTAFYNTTRLTEIHNFYKVYRFVRYFSPFFGDMSLPSTYFKHVNQLLHQNYTFWWTIPHFWTNVVSRTTLYHISDVISQISSIIINIGYSKSNFVDCFTWNCFW